MKTDSIKTTCMQNLPQQMKTPTHLSESLSWQRRGAVQSHHALFKNSFWVEKSWWKKKVENCSAILNAPLGVSSFTWPCQQQPASSKATLDTLHTHRETLIHTLAQAVTHTRAEDDGGVTGNHGDRTAASCRCVFPPFIHVPLHEKSQGLATHCKLVQRC